MAVEDDSGTLRLRIFAFVALSLFGALLTRLWYLQGIEYEEYQAVAESLVLREVYEEAPRGRILDRTGRVMVDNEVVDVVTIDRNAIDELDGDDRGELYTRLATTISRTGRLTKVASIEREVADPQYGPLDAVPVAVDVDPGLLVFLGERPDLFPGVEVISQTVRSYPFGPLAAHVLGYVGPVTVDELEVANSRLDPDDPRAKRYRLNSEIGKTGVERAFEDVLRGVPGVRYFEVDNRGEVIRERTELRRAPIPGDDLVLTLDVDLQALAERELAAGLDRARDRDPRGGEDDLVSAAGSAVAIDPRDGGVLAMASFPTYDPSDFVNGISFEQFEQLTSPDNYQPILNRAIQGTYAPGSTYKVITAFAALEKGYLGPTSPIEQARDGTIRDTGTYVYPFCDQELEAADTCEFESPFEGDDTFPLWRAISASSDVFFYTLGGEGFWREPAGPDGDEYMQTVSRAFGLGTNTGVQLPYERAGVVPDRDYFDAQAEAGVFLRDGSQWFPGDTIQLAIGQGDLLVSPLQLANLYATIGNGGTLHQLNIAARTQTTDGETVLEFGPRVLRELELPSNDLWEVEEGLVNVARSGTAAGPFAGFPLGEWSVAGKTGTAQVRGQADTSLFAAYGPTRQPGEAVGPEPDIAVAVVLEEAGFGSAAAAPITRAILEPWATDTMPRARTADELDREQAALVAAIAAADESATVADDGSTEEAP